MIRKILKTSAEEGLQSKAAALLVQVAGRFSSNIWIEMANKRVNAKSIMGVLSLKIRRGDAFAVSASGEDEAAAADAITRLIEKGEAGE